MDPLICRNFFLRVEECSGHFSTLTVKLRLCCVLVSLSFVDMSSLSIFLGQARPSCMFRVFALCDASLS